jgi:hypothetical protein
VFGDLLEEEILLAAREDDQLLLQKDHESVGELEVPQEVHLYDGGLEVGGALEVRLPSQHAKGIEFAPLGRDILLTRGVSGGRKRKGGKNTFQEE